MHEALSLMYDNCVKWRSNLSPQLRLVCRLVTPSARVQRRVGKRRHLDIGKRDGAKSLFRGLANVQKQYLPFNQCRNIRIGETRNEVTFRMTGNRSIFDLWWCDP